jgi:hypothetical protein
MDLNSGCQHQIIVAHARKPLPSQVFHRRSAAFSTGFLQPCANVSFCLALPVRILRFAIHLNVISLFRAPDGNCAIQLQQTQRPGTFNPQLRFGASFGPCFVDGYPTPEATMNSLIYLVGLVVVVLLILSFLGLR